jgi:peptidoglycan/LPS O-acetylase OafA/YrhL
MSLFIFRKKYYAPLILSLGVLSVSGLATPMVAEFLLGMIAAKLYQSKPARTFAPLTLAMGVLAFMLTAIFNITDAEDFSRSWVRVALWGIPSFLIIASIVNIKQLNFRVSTFLGDASYSIYLCHGICIFLYTQIEKFFFSEVAIGDLTSVSLCFAFSVGIGCVCYTLFEVPVTGSLRNFVKKRNFAVPDFRQHTRNELR